MKIERLLHPQEEVLIFLRRDKWVLLKMALLYGVLLFGPLAIVAIAWWFFPQWLDRQTAEPSISVFIILGSSLYYLFVWVFLYRAWLDYYLDVWFVTNERVVSIEQKGLFSRTIAEQRLFRIQDVHAEVHGVIATVLDFGNVTIQTAAAEVVFEFKEVPKPHLVARNIIKLVEWDKRRRNVRE